MKTLHCLLSSAVVLLVAAGTVAADDWRIFGAYGTVQIASKGGKPVTLDKDTSLMMKVPTGSTIMVAGKGKVVLVSLKSRQAFEIGDNSTAAVDPDVIRAINGSVIPRSGFAPPRGGDGRMGGIVMRGAGNRSCLKIVAPVNTNILEFTPELIWENRCSGLDKVSLTIISDERVVHAAEAVAGTSYRVPANLLKEDTRYLWMVDGGASFDMASSIFRVASDKERSEVLQRMQVATLTSSPEDRIANIYFLSDRGFAEIARKETMRLRAEFPESSGLTELP